MLDESTIKDETRVTLYYNIAMINFEQGRDSMALMYFQKAENLISARVFDTEPLIPQSLYSSSTVPPRIHILNNMACLYQKNGDPESALLYFAKALNDERSDRINKATVCDNIGLLYYSKGDYETALQHLSQALELAQDHSSLAKFKQHYDAVKRHLLSKNISDGKK
ncbi:unnamed protein product [Rotaria sordida]|nr:unnamed protein product [Rotaria sordida]